MREPWSNVLDGDDEIHVSSITRLEVSGRSVLRAVVSWLENGTWVARTVELGEIAHVSEGELPDSPRAG